MQNFRVTHCERRTMPYGDGWFAVVTSGKNDVQHFSRYDNEKQWHCDARFEKGILPVFCNGAGSRCTQPIIAGSVLLEALNEAVAMARKGGAA